MHTNRFIVFEGIDGSGKTMLAKMLESYLRARQIKVEYTRGIFPPYERVRRDIHLNQNAQASYFFYVSANCLASVRVAQMLKASWIICDRYIHTTNAYHAARGVSPIIAPEQLALLMPDLVLHVTVSSLAIADARIRARNAEAPTPNEAPFDHRFIERVENGYRNMKMTRIDNSKQPVDGLRAVVDALQPLLPSVSS